MSVLFLTGQSYFVTCKTFFQFQFVIFIAFCSWMIANYSETYRIYILTTNCLMTLYQFYHLRQRFYITHQHMQWNVAIVNCPHATILCTTQINIVVCSQRYYKYDKFCWVRCHYGFFWSLFFLEQDSMYSHWLLTSLLLNKRSCWRFLLSKSW